jgi:hypothetical protein
VPSLPSPIAAAFTVRPTARPCSDDPEQSDGKDRNEGSRSIDQGRQPVCYVQVKAVATPDRSSGLGDKQGQTVERVRHACQAFGCLIGEQALRWRLDLQGDQPVDSRLADSMQTSRVRRPGRRAGWSCRDISLRGRLCRTVPAFALAWSSGSQAR